MPQNLVDSLHWTHYLPFITTVLSVAFFVVLLQAALVRRSGPHLWWWAFGALCYGSGTLVESLIAIHGNTVLLTKLWYVTGALLGGYPLAQGAAYLHVKRSVANRLSYTTLAVVVAGSVCTMLSPVDMSQFQPMRPSGALLQWLWIRIGITPLVNTYALIFLVGGAIRSAIRCAKRQEDRYRLKGNVLIAVGGLMPGVGGGLAAAKFVEALYILELVGLTLIWLGYGSIAKSSHRYDAPATQ